MSTVKNKRPTINDFLIETFEGPGYSYPYVAWDHVLEVLCEAYDFNTAVTLHEALYQTNEGWIHGILPSILEPWLEKLPLTGE